MMNPKKLVIASRESALAMWQAKHIQAQLQALYPDCEVSILGMTTRGDQILDHTLSKIGGKGLFIKELEQALQALNDYQIGLVALYYEDDKSVKDISEIYQISEAKVKTDLYRLRQQLKKEMEQNDETK